MTMDEIEVFFLDQHRAVSEVVDDPVFSNVSEFGEVYELFEIQNISHEYLNHPQRWTHRAQVRRHNSHEIFNAELRVVNFSIEDSVVYYN